jgi:hypothetical protein
MAGVGPAKTIFDAKNKTRSLVTKKKKKYLPNLVGFHCARAL